MISDSCTKASKCITDCCIKPKSTFYEMRIALIQEQVSKFSAAHYDMLSWTTVQCTIKSGNDICHIADGNIHIIC